MMTPPGGGMAASPAVREAAMNFGEPKGGRTLRLDSGELLPKKRPWEQPGRKYVHIYVGPKAMEVRS